MSNRTQLSPDTWIEGEYLYTESMEIAEVWATGVQERIRGGREWFPVIEDWFCYVGSPLRIRRDDCRPLYEYREGEPWCWPSSAFAGAHVEVYKRESKLVDALHLRAVMVCGGSADSLRAFHAWLGEGIDE